MSIMTKSMSKIGEIIDIFDSKLKDSLKPFIDFSLKEIVVGEKYTILKYTNSKCLNTHSIDITRIVNDYNKITDSNCHIDIKLFKIDEDEYSIIPVTDGYVIHSEYDIIIIENNQSYDTNTMVFNVNHPGTAIVSNTYYIPIMSKHINVYGIKIYIKENENAGNRNESNQ